MYEEFSRHLSWILDKLGYNRHIMNYRRESYQELDNVFNKAIVNYIFQLAGSKREGLTSVYESDADALFIDPFSICLEDESLNVAAYSQINVMIMDFNAMAGHTRLRLKHLKNGGIDNHILRCLECIGPIVYLSSKKFLESASNFIRKNLTCEEYSVKTNAGPSVPGSMFDSDIDNVFVFRCECPVILNTWASRCRKVDWPPVEVRDKVVGMGGVVAATGVSSSENKHLEWRLCFNAGETELVAALNECQCKLYVLLKAILKEIIIPHQKEVTSFIMKNVVFWLAEMFPQSEFNDSTLFHWTIKALRFLKRSIKLKFFPYYMIPERNLLAEKMTPILKDRLVYKINCILSRGPWAMFVIPKLYNAMVTASPEQLLRFHNARQENEELKILLAILKASMLRENCFSKSEYDLRWMKDGDIRRVFHRQVRLVFTDLEEITLRKKGYDVDQLFYDTQKLLLM